MPVGGSSSLLATSSGGHSCQLALQLGPTRASSLPQPLGSMPCAPLCPSLPARLCNPPASQCAGAGGGRSHPSISVGQAAGGAAAADGAGAGSPSGCVCEKHSARLRLQLNGGGASTGTALRCAFQRGSSQPRLPHGWRVCARRAVVDTPACPSPDLQETDGSSWDAVQHSSAAACSLWA